MTETMHTSVTHPYAVETHSAAETQALGHQLGSLVQAGHIIALRGDLGAGKTTFTQGLAAGMGITARVTSPTFTLVNEYQGRGGLQLIHVDVYRLADTAPELDAATFGLEEILDSAGEPTSFSGQASGAVVVIEWADRVAGMLTDDHLAVNLEATGDSPDRRRIVLTAHGPHSAALLQALAQRVPSLRPQIG